MIANAHRSFRSTTTSDPVRHLHTPAGRPGRAEVGVRGHSGYFGRIARLANGRALAVLVCAALFGFHTPAHARTTEIWSATLTVGEHSSLGTVFRGYQASHSSGNLSDDLFVHDGIAYTIVTLNHAIDGPLWFGTDRTGANALGNRNSGMALLFETESRSTEFILARHQYGNGAMHHWTNTGLSWNVGDVIRVRLLVARASDSRASPSLTVTLRETSAFRTSSSRGFSYTVTWQP